MPLELVFQLVTTATAGPPSTSHATSAGSASAQIRKHLIAHTSQGLQQQKTQGRRAAGIIEMPGWKMQTRR